MWINRSDDAKLAKEEKARKRKQKRLTQEAGV